MTFETLGNPSNPAALLIHGMLCSGHHCEPFGKYLADEYYVIMPTLDGHGHDGTDLLTVEEEARKLTGYLKENGIQSLALLQGSSMGAEVALAVRKQCEIEGIAVTCSFFDGGPFFHFNPFFRRVMYKKFRTLGKVFDTDDPDEAYRNIINNPFVKFVAKGKISQYEGMIKSMARERRTFSQKTLKNMVRICYQCDPPVFSTDAQKSFIFFFSDEEPARDSRSRLIKLYPDATFEDIHGYAHCGYQSSEPEAYVRKLKKAIRDRI
ncbi:MAG: alpha/beta hydrolase [Clostridia bacterium]|nr:alpha/beta hydrolase [Clostridia bacterium]